MWLDGSSVLEVVARPSVVARALLEKVARRALPEKVATKAIPGKRHSCKRALNEFKKVE